jgi:hypothetical protein
MFINVFFKKLPPLPSEALNTRVFLIMGMPGAKIQNAPQKGGVKVLKGLPRIRSEVGKFHEENGKRYISESMAATILSRAAFLENRLESRGARFKKEFTSFVKMLFETGKAKAVEYGDGEDREFLTALPYVRVSADDSPEDKERKMDVLTTFCMDDAGSEMHFLINMKRKFFQRIEVTDAEAKKLREIEGNMSYSRYFSITE